MLALVALVLFVLAGFDVKVGDISPFDLLAFGLAFLAAHLAFPMPLRRRS